MWRVGRGSRVVLGGFWACGGGLAGDACEAIGSRQWAIERGDGGPRALSGVPPPSRREDAPIHLPQCFALEEEIWTLNRRRWFASTSRRLGEVDRCEASRRRGFCS